MALNKAKVFTVTSVKGGTGKTTTLLNLAGIYSRLNKKVLIVDLDLYSGDVASILNLNYKNDIYNLFEDINNNEFNSLEDYMYDYNNNIKVLSAPKDPRFGRKINSKVLNIILYKASMKFDVILIDTNHILTDINLFALEYDNKTVFGDDIFDERYRGFLFNLSDGNEDAWIDSKTAYYNKYHRTTSIINANNDENDVAYFEKQADKIRLSHYLLDNDYFKNMP